MHELGGRRSGMNGLREDQEFRLELDEHEMPGEDTRQAMEEVSLEPW